MANAILAQMNSDTTAQIASLDSSISSIDDQIETLDGQIDAVETDVCGAAQTSLQEYLTTSKLPSYPGGYVVMGSNPIVYGGSLSNWSINQMIVAPVIPPELPGPAVDTVVYSLGVGWDSDPTITQIMGDWSYGCDYLTRPITSGATYGLIPYQANMTNVRGMLTANKTKLEASQDVLPRYM